LTPLAGQDLAARSRANFGQNDRKIMSERSQAKSIREAAMIETDKFEKVEVTDAGQLRDWLLANHTQTESIWLVTYKKHVPDKYVSVAEILDEVLCFGWIDGIRRQLDADRTRQLLAPRTTLGQKRQRADGAIRAGAADASSRNEGDR
jgi:hypothetical protein